MAKRVKYHVVGGCVTCMTCIYQCPVQAITIIAAKNRLNCGESKYFEQLAQNKK